MFAYKTPQGVICWFLTNIIAHVEKKRKGHSEMYYSAQCHWRPCKFWGIVQLACWQVKSLCKGRVFSTTVLDRTIWIETSLSWTVQCYDYKWKFHWLIRPNFHRQQCNVLCSAKALFCNTSMSVIAPHHKNCNQNLLLNVKSVSAPTILKSGSNVLSH